MSDKIISCNPTLVKSLILSGNMPEKYLENGFEKSLKQYETKFPVKKFFYDRTGTIPHFLKVDETKFRIPDINGFNMTFDQVAEKRAKELLALGKTINVSWSGGIDSTFTLLTLHHFAEDKSQVRVYGTYNSVLESGNFFDKFIFNKIPFDIHCTRSIENNYPIKPDEIYVTGSMGNDIINVEPVSGHRDQWMIFKDPSLNFKTQLSLRYEDALQDSNLEFLSEVIKKSPKKIETLQDLRWWVSFNFNWYNCISNSYIGGGPEKVNVIHSFFGSEDFQRWSMTNNDVATKTGDYSDERWQLREKITEYTGCDEFSKSKKNGVSVLSNFGNKWVFLLQDYSNIYTDTL